MKVRTLLDNYQQARRAEGKRRAPGGKKWLTVEELEARTMPAAGLVAAYNFDQGSGRVLTDVSGNGNNGTITNASWVTTGKFGGALSFNGALNSFVTVADSVSLHLTRGMTLEAWVNPRTLNSSLNGWVTPLAKENHASTDNDNDYELFTASGAKSKPSGYVLVGNTDEGVNAASALPLNRWTFLATTYDGATLKLYVNGALVGSRAVSGSIATSADPLRIGGNWSGEMFNGLIDNVRIYNTTLTQSAIQADMAAPVVPQAAPPAVGSVTPANGANGVALAAAVQVTFTGAIDPATVNATTVQLVNTFGAVVSAAVSFNAATNTATLTPSSALAAGSAYKVLVHGGSSGAVVKNTSGTALAADFTSAFSTAAPVPSAPQPFPNNLTPPPLPAPTGSVVRVASASALQSAVANLQSGQTIFIAPGTYDVTDTLWVPQGIHDVAIRGSSGNASDVVIRGAGMSGPILFGFWVGNTQNITFADLTVRDFADHAFIFNAGAQSPLIHNVTMIDVGEQFVKSNPDGNGGGVNNGVVEYSTMKYTTVAPSYYTNGIDVHTGNNWIVRDNVFENIRADGALAGPAVLFWNHSQNPTVEGNTFINNQRDISFGLDPTTANDNTGGIIRNNFIFRSGPQGGDVGIYLGNSPGTEVANNTVVLNGDYPNAIEYRFTNTTGVTILYNLTDAAITSRDGATAILAGNVTDAQPSWFVNAATGDLHLTAAATGAIGQAQFLPAVGTDYDGQTRSAGATDVGADQYGGGSSSGDTQAPTVSVTSPAAGATLSGTVTVTASASDNVGVVGVQFYLDGAALGAEDTAAPYTVRLDTTKLANGSHTLTARARDAAGNAATSAAVSFTVFNDTQAPTVTVTGPTAGSMVSGTVRLSATASDNVGVVGVQFYIGTTPVGAAAIAAPYVLDWNSWAIPNGSYTLTAQAWDAAGNRTTSAAISFTVSNVLSVTSVTPATGTVDVLPNATVSVSFSGALDPATVNSGTVQLLDPSGAAVPAGVLYNAASFTATLTPSSNLALDTVFTVLVHGGSSGAAVKDAVGRTLPADFTSTFTTDAPVPPAASAGPARSGNEGSAVTFSGSVTGGSGALSYAWDFGDGTTGSGTLTPSHVYDDNGTYVVTLTVTDALGASSRSTTSAVIANVAPTANLGGPYRGAPGSPIIFAGSASDVSAADTAAGFRYRWNFGDGTTASTAKASHTYAAAGVYTVSLTVTDKDGGFSTAVATATVSELTDSQEPLLYQNNLQYVGAFRVPGGTFGASTFEYGGTALAFNPANNSLFIVGHDWDQAVAEIAIPTSIVNSPQVGDLSTATVLQPFVSVLSEIPNDTLAGRTVKIGGLMVVNGQLVGTAYDYYDGDVNAQGSHFKVSDLNLSTGSVTGYFDVGNLGPGFVAGYMAPIPAEWQSALGAPYLTGQSDIPVIGRTSSGPAAFGFDPNALGPSTAPDQPYLYYPLTNPLGAYEGPANPLQNGTTTIKGIAFVPGTSSVLYFGTAGTNYSGYGLSEDFGDAVNTGKGPHSLNGEYAFQVWAYNANDFVAVNQGALQPWQVQPYDVWNFTLPVSGSQIGGVALDPNTGRLYVSVLGADTLDPYSYRPLIEVFQVAVPGLGATPAVAPPPAAPQIGTLAATPDTLVPGPIPAGTSITLTAGNVYDLNDTSSVRQVAFYVDSNNNGVLDTTTDQLLGYGTASAALNASHNYSLTFSSSWMAPGTYTIFAQVLNTDSLFSDPIATQVTIA